MLSEPPGPRLADGSLPLYRTLSLGDVRLHIIEAGTQLQDGGAIFGIVPRPRWSALYRPDALNRITLALRCLLVETPDELVLIDTGIGSKRDRRFREANGVANEPKAGYAGRDRLEAAVHHLGFGLSDVTTVINTHLHFDHAGGNTVETADGIEPTFPEARYIVQKGEWNSAGVANERTAGAYRPKDFRVLAEMARVRFVDGRATPVPGISTLPTPGHTPYHQSVLIETGDGTVCFAGDILPTSAHLPVAWSMAFDVEPFRTMESKRELVRRAAAEEWIVLTPHDPEHPAGRIALDGSRAVYRPLEASFHEERRSLSDGSAADRG